MHTTVGAPTTTTSHHPIEVDLKSYRATSERQAIRKGPIITNSSIYVPLSSYSKKVKWSRYRRGVAQRVCRGIALLFHDRGTGRWWVVSSTPRPHFTPGKDPVPIVQEAGWAPGPVWTGGKSRPHRDSISDSPARSSVSIPTDLPGPPINLYTFYIYISHFRF